MPGKPLFLAALLLVGFSGPIAPAPHLGRSAEATDATASRLKLDRDKPALDVRVTNHTGKPCLLRGWLDGEQASVEVPDRSAIVTLQWRKAREGEVRLELRAEGKAVDEERFRAAVGSGYDYYQPTIIKAPPQAGAPPQQGGGAPPPQAGPAAQQAGMQAAAAPPPLVPGAVLAVTGVKVAPYVLLGGGLLAFGLLVLGLSWILSRRSPTE